MHEYKIILDVNDHEYEVTLEVVADCVKHINGNIVEINGASVEVKGMGEIQQIVKVK